MKRISYFLSALAAGMMFVSCTSVQKSAVVMDDLSNRIYTHPVVGELEAKPRAELTLTRRDFKGATNPEAFVTASLVKQQGADLLLERRTVTVRKWNLFKGMRTTSVTISGLPATYKNFHSMTREDYDLFIDPVRNCCTHKKTTILPDKAPVIVEEGCCGNHKPTVLEKVNGQRTVQ